METADRRCPIPTSPHRAKIPEGCCVEGKQNQLCPPLPHVEPGSAAQVGSAEGVRSCGLGRGVGRGLGLGQRGAVCPGLRTWGPGRPQSQCGSAVTSREPSWSPRSSGWPGDGPASSLLSSSLPPGRESHPGRRENGPAGGAWAAFVCRAPCQRPGAPKPGMGSVTGVKSWSLACRCVQPDSWGSVCVRGARVSPSLCHEMGVRSAHQKTVSSPHSAPRGLQASQGAVFPYVSSARPRNPRNATWVNAQ